MGDGQDDANIQSNFEFPSVATNAFANDSWPSFGWNINGLDQFLFGTQNTSLDIANAVASGSGVGEPGQGGIDDPANMLSNNANVFAVASGSAAGEPGPDGIDAHANMPLDNANAVASVSGAGEPGPSEDIKPRFEIVPSKYLFEYNLPFKYYILINISIFFQLELWLVLSQSKNVLK